MILEYYIEYEIANIKRMRNLKNKFETYKF